ncbi:pirin family protein [Pseudomonas sp. 10B1]|uniref:pirin family protein n=1 Tax=unclassified Pseudomonas TaxID=196821 RepID=UPI002AB48259|nr:MULTISPECIES: pirin family protein [unclassified Pseudomonas]MDY7560359.1 pirin family protein [Pseudomonas sp. AB6]MEA9975526.1 pirin family protein [Pseudomonas sp. RTS4]MEA9993989.1 pirin family protein [Pseudomonas sp. AA4]MEB0089322.1 pirin family protein [Pseudomonas sp. RTI1]MEB0124393.1 pirin family protein [Pseudomonas sp. CCC1.2]
MLELRPFNTLGGADHGWLNAHHHFSFAEYYDPKRMNWGQLRVWNDDVIAAGTGFPKHPHRDMEIITYVREGAITHEDSLGNKGRTEAGDVQVMSAGTGIAHSEYNKESTETRIFQIWIVPDETGSAPSWGAKPFPKGDREGFVTLASGKVGDDQSLRIRADARLVAANLKAGETAEYSLDAGRRAYLVPATGVVEVNGLRAVARDGVAVEHERILTVTAIEDSEVILVDVA